MKTVIVTGSNGLVGSETCRFYDNLGYQIIGIDNDMRSYFFGPEASTISQRNKMETELNNYKHYSCDIRDKSSLDNIFNEYNSDIVLVVHSAAQPSHDWSVNEPLTDFGVNAVGTLNLLESTRQYCSEAVFIFTSTNKVYGDLPNKLPLVERETRWDINDQIRDVNMSDKWYHEWGVSSNGINENMSIDKSTHSLFGASKVAADVMVQEYGRYFGMKTGTFRGGCLTGESHKGAELHGFLAYLIKCAVHQKPYTIFGYKGKQVRDNIHSYDLINAFHQFYLNPRPGEVYNIGGSMHSNISMLEAIDMIKDISGYQVNYTISEQNRIGDHMWYISDVSKFRQHYPDWEYKYDIRMILSDMIKSCE